MEKALNKITLLLAALALVSCGSSESPSSSSSEKPEDLTTYFSTYKDAGEAYYAQDNVGESSTDFSFDFSTLSLTTKDGKTTETSSDIYIENACFISKKNGINAEKATSLSESFVMSQGSLQVNTLSYKSFKPAFYLKDYKAYLDFSENRSIPLILTTAIKGAGNTDWSFPSSGLGYYPFDSEEKAALDTAMPIGDNYQDQIATDAATYKETYLQQKELFTLSKKDGVYSFVYSTTNRGYIATWIKNAAESQFNLTSEQKSKLEEQVDQYLSAATVNSFSLSYSYSATSLISETLDIDITADSDTLKTTYPDSTFFLTSLFLKGSIDYLSGEEAANAIPDDFDASQYTEISKPTLS